MTLQTISTQHPMSMIILEDGKDPQKIDPSKFESENRLQELLHDNPEAIPLYEINADVKLLILVREFGTESGPIDALGTDQNGEIYIIETKLVKNSDRRNVIAQSLDYGASLWRKGSDFSKFTSTIDEHVRKKFDMSFQEKLTSYFEIDEDNLNTLLTNLERNLKDGRFKFIIPMDKIEERLKDLIVFINQNSNFDVYAVELEYYKLETQEIIIPKLFGTEVKKTPISNSIPDIDWNEEKFFTRLKDTFNESSAEYQAIHRLYEFSTGQFRLKWGRGSQHGSFSVILDKVSPRSLYGVNTEGKLSLNFGWLDETKDQERYRDAFRETLVKELPQFNIPEDYQDRMVKIPLETWSPVVDKFIESVTHLTK